jgi:hypothetical protein
MTDPTRPDGKCLACGHVWTLAHLPLDVTATQPIPLSAGDRRVMVNGGPLPVPFRIVSEELWAELKAKLVAKDALLRQAHDAMSRRATFTRPAACRASQEE